MTGAAAALLLAFAPLPPPGPGARADALVRGFPATVSFYAKNLTTGATRGLREGDRVRTASTIKLPILVTLFRLAEQGSLAWTDTVEMRPADRIGGAGVMAELSDGVKLSLRDAARLMIVVSDNTATNLILDRISADAVNAELDRLALPNTRSLRKVLGAAGPAGLSRAGHDKENQRFGIGVTTPREMVTLLEKIVRAEGVSKPASKEIIEILKRQQFKDAIGRHTKYPVASKSGALDRLRADVGLVFTPKGTIALALTVDGLPETDWSADNRGQKLLSELSNLLVEELTK